MVESCPEHWQEVLFPLGVSAEDVSLDSQVTATSVIPAHQETQQAMSGDVFSCQLREKGTYVSSGIIPGLLPNILQHTEWPPATSNSWLQCLVALPWRKPKTNKNFHSKPSFLCNKANPIRTLAENRTRYPTEQRKVNLLKSLKESHNVIYDQFY